MKAFEQTITKEEFVSELEKHQAADNFIRRTYWNGSKGCAVGCSLESISRLKKIKMSFENHEMYETHLGIPEWLARLEDTIFEGVSEKRARSWPVEFAKAINPGADLEKTKTPFLIMILENCLDSMSSVKFDTKAFPDVVKAVERSRAAVLQMIEAHKNENPSAAWSAAKSAAKSAASAAWSAESAAASAAWSAAESAAWSAAKSAAWSAAWSAAYEYYADGLLGILREIK